jgi:dihydroorotase-like cyclic amidohydrolase
MTLRYQLVIKGGTLCTPGGPIVADVGIREGQIAAIGDAGRRRPRGRGDRRHAASTSCPA